ncbi:MAG: hypothetical protein ACD_75C01016G0003 [uncultured bacterium]|nr:MAG: hypothetical protein ACD_75C01016G0003 [uncultured bacterium]
MIGADEKGLRVGPDVVQIGKFCLRVHDYRKINLHVCGKLLQVLTLFIKAPDIHNLQPLVAVLLVKFLEGRGIGLAETAVGFKKTQDHRASPQAGKDNNPIIETLGGKIGRRVAQPQALRRFLRTAPGKDQAEEHDQ